MFNIYVYNLYPITKPTVHSFIMQYLWGCIECIWHSMYPSEWIIAWEISPQNGSGLNHAYYALVNIWWCCYQQMSNPVFCQRWNHCTFVIFHFDMLYSLWWAFFDVRYILNELFRQTAHQYESRIYYETHCSSTCWDRWFVFSH